MRVEMNLQHQDLLLLLVNEHKNSKTTWAPNVNLLAGYALAVKAVKTLSK